MMPIRFDPETRLTKNFWLSEFLVSSRYPEAVESTRLFDPEIIKFYWLCHFALQPIRDRFGYVKITSGFRTVYLNSLLGGAGGSQHCYAEAADFIPTEANAEQVYEWILDELGWGGEVFLYKKAGHIHLAMPRPNIKTDQKILRA